MINLNLKIDEARKAFEDKNYDKALEILDGETFGEEYQKLVYVLRIGCLRNLKRYDEALAVIESGIEKYPYYDFFWFQKVTCYYFNDENDEAVKSLAKLEDVIDRDDKNALVMISDLFEMVGDYENALKYCDMALAIDENFADAIRQKAMVASSLEDDEMMSECADRLLELYDKDILKLMIPLMLKLFSKRYKDALGIVNGVDVLDREYDVLMKSAIYNTMTNDLNIELKTSAPIEMTIDEGLNLLFDYHYDGVESGKVRGISYIIIKKE